MDSPRHQEWKLLSFSQCYYTEQRFLEIYRRNNASEDERLEEPALTPSQLKKQMKVEDVYRSMARW